MGVMAKLLGLETTTVMWIESIETGVFGEIVVRGLAAFLFNKYCRIIVRESIYSRTRAIVLVG